MRLYGWEDNNVRETVTACNDDDEQSLLCLCARTRAEWKLNDVTCVNVYKIFASRSLCPEYLNNAHSTSEESIPKSGIFVRPALEII